MTASTKRRTMAPYEKPKPATGTGRKKRLSRELVLSAALALVDAEGLDALTIRRLGQELGRDPMGLYRYAANRTKAALTGTLTGKAHTPCFYSSASKPAFAT